VVRSAAGRQVDGGPFTAAQMAAGVSFDGVSLRIAAGTAQAGDRFLMRPVAGAAQGMSTVLSNPKGLAAAAPFVASMAQGNAGTAEVASLAAVDPSYDRTLSATFEFTDDNGGYAWTLSDGTTGTGTWSAGSPIALNGFELTLSGVPKSGDRIDVSPTVSVSGNNGNAYAFANLADAGIVASAALPDGSFGAGMSATDAYASAIADIGVRVSGGKAAATLSAGVAQAAQTARDNAAGVNLDEEAARLIQYQQSYQAAAKILQVAQSVFDTLLQTAGG
jgi:flagellar hook-associated protein 1 FlgK